MTGTNCDLFTHNQSRSYLNHLVLHAFKTEVGSSRLLIVAFCGSMSSRHVDWSIISTVSDTPACRVLAFDNNRDVLQKDKFISEK
jgi:hypothetical protein